MISRPPAGLSLQAVTSNSSESVSGLITKLWYRVAWSAVRSAAWESHHVWQPRAAELREADAQLARLDGPGPGIARAVESREPGRGVAFVLALAGGATAAVFGLWWLLGQERASSSSNPGVRLAAFSCLVGALAWGWALLQL